MKRPAREVIDDTNDSRQGKRVTREGMEGKWPSFVCIPVKGVFVHELLIVCVWFVDGQLSCHQLGSPIFETLKQNCIQHFRRFHPLTQEELVTLSEIENTHISLSREFSLRFHQIEPFVSRLDAHLPPLLRRSDRIFLFFPVLISSISLMSCSCVTVLQLQGGGLLEILDLVQRGEVQGLSLHPTEPGRRSRRRW